jgi:carotenoid 1,2-hydratase
VPSGGGRADGSPVRQARGRGDSDRPDFRVEVGPDGYAWWYVDGVSACGTRAISIIGFIGSVFSPWYAWSGRRDPQNHCCLNVVTYGPGGRFTMTDRGRPALRQSRDALEIGPSAMRWTGRELVIEVDEISSFPLVSRVKGTITLTPQAITDQEVALHPRHIWRPFAPMAQITVNLTQGHSWQGHGYFDANFGTAALEADFDRWTWGRFPLQDRAMCFYDATRRDGTTLALGVEVGPDGALREVTPPPLTRFSRTRWQVARDTRADAGTRPRQVMAMLDAPFYSRSVVETTIDGEVSHGVHEALDLRRFRNPLLKFMLATRVPRRRNWP